MKQPPLGIYIVAIVFLFAGLLCAAELFGLMLAALGSRIYLNRLLLALPLIASCAYVARPRFRRESREFRAARSLKPKA